MSPLISCKQASRLISQSLDRRLSLRERLALRFHLLLCDVCTRFRRQLGLMRRLVRQARIQIEQDKSITLPSAAKVRMAQVIAAERD